MRRARNTGVIIPDGLLTTILQLVIRQVDMALNKGLQVFFNRCLIDGRRRHDFGIGNDAGIIDCIAMIANAAGRLGATVAGSGLRLDLDSRLIRFFITLYDLSGLIKCLNNLNEAGLNAFKRVTALRT